MLRFVSSLRHFTALRAATSVQVCLCHGHSSGAIKKVNGYVAVHAFHRLSQRAKTSKSSLSKVLTTSPHQANNPVDARKSQQAAKAGKNKCGPKLQPRASEHKGSDAVDSATHPQSAKKRKSKSSPSKVQKISAHQASSPVASTKSQQAAKAGKNKSNASSPVDSTKSQQVAKAGKNKIGPKGLLKASEHQGSDTAKSQTPPQPARKRKSKSGLAEVLKDAGQEGSERVDSPTARHLARARISIDQGTIPEEKTLSWFERACTWLSGRLGLKSVGSEGSDQRDSLKAQQHAGKASKDMIGPNGLIKASEQEASEPVDLPKSQQPAKARIFINGDAMPTEATLSWLDEVCKHHQDVTIWKAIGSHHDICKSVAKLQAGSGLPSGKVHVLQAHSKALNAADALLTALYGRHAQTDAMNYVLSDDKKWFSELPHIFSDVPTTWLTFRELPKKGVSFSRPRASPSEGKANALSPSKCEAGLYQVAQTVDVSRGFRLRSSSCGSVAAGSQVKVVQVRRVDKDKCVRGLIKKPPGWIPLRHTESGHEWARLL
eukprot:TRINITY_DN44827_c0_g1_i1.p1 TRINITY_DN44827_c0_g1~~TRINITY_DN44827_c0_g1_i1.p1  ORF type:complete len:546 (-),score=61.32 TRINITY_DN44827_c0_g1_i1:359-1996(-)